MLGGDRRRIRMVYSLLFSLPGIPALYYGEEIGMGENLAAERRMAVRSPMQWTSGTNGGFSPADPDRLASAVVEGDFGPCNVNVADARADSGSLLHFISTLTRRYRECIELAWGPVEVLDQPVRQVLAHRCTWEGSSIVALHNLGPETVTVPLHLPGEDEGTELVDLLENGRSTLNADAIVELSLESYGFRWLRVQRSSGAEGILPNILTTGAAAEEN